MKLYPVTITYTTMVVADNPYNAECVAQENLASIFEDGLDDVVVQNAIEDEQDLPLHADSLWHIVKRSHSEPR